MTFASRPRLSHVGIFVQNMAPMLEFYLGVFGFVVSDEGYGTVMPVKLVFLTGDSSMHHQLVLASGRPAEAAFSTVNQLSFTVTDLDQLRAIRLRLLEYGATDIRGVNHGNAWSVYAHDPEGNTIEVYLDSPFYVPQPHYDPLDLNLTDEEILEQTEQACRQDSAFMLREDWQRELAKKLEEAS
ncbi:VOC family protein [Woeseia oceani]|uniref:Glyoxalase n=1 Tax=Woeseia oceani TaxID=1548547 RepID=A0A193LDB5_9GAMM|nr:VOC family protein [Woeseia oceani]ANO50520.1 glyoxalase [Woeseia oceani]